MPQLSKGCRRRILSKLTILKDFQTRTIDHPAMEALGDPPGLIETVEMDIYKKITTTYTQRGCINQEVNGKKSSPVFRYLIRFDIALFAPCECVIDGPLDFRPVKLD